MSSFFILGFFGFLEVLFKYLGNILTALINFFLYSPLTLIFIGIILIAAFSEMVFKKVAGLDTIYVGGIEFGGTKENGNGQDLVYAFITDPAVQNVFWAIIGLSLVLLFIFTIVALIRSEFALDLKGNAKAPIIGRALKSLANFIIVPVTALISVVGVNFITQSVYTMFDDITGDSIVSKCFHVGAYNANRARLSATFAKQLSTGEDFDDTPIFVEGENPFAGMDQREVAFAIDEFFLKGEIKDIKYNPAGVLDRLEDCVGDGYINFLAIFLGYPETGEFSYFDLQTINFYYDIAQFDYILMVGSAICMCWILLSTCLVLIKRVFELTILFLLAPAMIAIAPLDGGQAEKKWRQEFMKRLLAVVGPVFAFNMYFLLVPIFSNITLFGPGSFSGLAACSSTFLTSGSMLGSTILILMSFMVIFNLMFQIIFIIVGMSIVKSASALLSNLLGIEDLVKAGDEAGKKAIKTGATVFKGAAALAVPAVKGAAMTMKAAKGASAASKAGKLKDKTDKAKAAMDKAAEGGTESEEYIAAKERYEKAQGKQDAFDRKHSSSDDVLAKDFDEGRKSAYDKLDDLEKQKNDIAEQLESGSLTKKQKNALRGRQKELNEEIIKARKDAFDQYGGKDGTGFLEKRNAAIAEARQEQVKDLYSGNGFFKEYSARKKDLKEREYGSDAEKTSMFAGIGEKSERRKKFDDSRLGKIWDYLGGNKYSGANKEMLKVMFNPDTSEFGNPYGRRMDDFITDIMGEKGSINKILFNKNSRATELVENAPESKKRNTGVEQQMSWTAKANVDKSLEEKKNRKSQEEILRRMLAEDKKGNREMKEYLDLCKQKDATNPNDYARIQELNAQIESAAMKNGLSAEARNYYNSMKKGDEGKAKKFSEYDQKMKLDAERKAQDSKAANDARVEKVKQEAIAKGGKVETKVAEESSAKLARDIGKAVKNALNEGSGYGGKATQMPDLAPLLTGLESLKELPNIMATLQEAINKLGDKKE